MRRWLNAALFLVWGLGLTSVLGAQASELVPVPLEWQAVEGAGGYKVEIKNEAQKVVFSENVSVPKATANLPPGIYQLQISSLNRFGKVEASTPWTPLTVKKIPTPTVDAFSPQNIEESEPFLLTVEATGIDEKTRWELVRVEKGTPYSPQKVTLSEEGGTLEFPGLPLGTYTLRATGKTGKKGSSSAILTVDRHAPVPTGLSSTRFDPNVPLAWRVLGKYLEPTDSVILVDSDGNRTPVKVVSKASDGSLNVASPALVPGDYTLEVSLTPETPPRVPLTFLVLKPGPVLDSLTPLPFDEGSDVQGVDLMASSLTPDMQVFLVVANRRLPLVIQGQEPDRLTVDVPRNLAAGEYDLVMVNDQQRETVVRGGVTIKEDGTVRASYGSVEVLASLPGARAFLDTGESFELPHVFTDVEAGKHVVSFSIEEEGRRFFSAADQSVTVAPHQKATVRGVYQKGVFHLIVPDLPPGYYVKLDGHLVDSEKLKPPGLALESGRYTVEALSPAGQSWIGNLAGQGGGEEVSRFAGYVPVVPTRSIPMAGDAREWKGLEPIITDRTEDHRAPGPGTDLRAVWLAQDAERLYIRFDLANGDPSRIKGSDYTLEIPTPHGNLNINTHYGNFKDGDNFRTDLWSNSRGNWDGAGSYRTMPSGLEVSVPWSTLVQYGVQRDWLTTFKAYFNRWSDDPQSWQKTNDEAQRYTGVWLTKPKLALANGVVEGLTPEDALTIRAKLSELSLQRSALRPQYEVRNTWDALGWGAVWTGLAAGAAAGYASYRVMTDFSALSTTQDPGEYATLKNNVMLYRPIALVGAGVTLSAAILGTVFFHTGVERWDLDNQTDSIDQQIALLESFF